ncbi:hypothetical protein TRV_00067 [Trichophyton verrucosum HKI 0517]|uniref:Enoyl reductase (ER) domain-containing protein n=1 Tax=Trichophyton verrucosum (strain HKI 0517) TaxID=663202 RepID=D4CZ30_TRIVH|nr:uncharacterized protein TRV_00067 [Trichophyton verrucosum HKI 0517]EFE45129.1 hypothetical protein TRV_00067 [Trichophyton verrucosum HKI 0517]
MDIPKTFKQAIFKEKGAPLVLEEVPMTPPGNGEVLVKVQACGVCHSDVYVQNDGLGAGLPRVPGHEIIGHVAAIGEGVTQWKVGDRIGGAWHGGHDDAEYCLLRAEAGVRVPADVDAAVYAPILCAGVTVFNSMRNMKLMPGSTVAIQGLGGLGHLAIQYANKFGYRVVALSRGSDKEKFAKELGAHIYIDGGKGDVGEQLQAIGGADMIVSTAPSRRAVEPLLKGLGMLGKLLVLSIPGDITVNTGLMCWPSGHATDSEDAIEFTKLENINCMMEKFPLAKVQEAYDAMVKGTVRFRAVITME